MCGIVGYVGGKQAASVLLEGLKRLEYRGYDSAGLCILCAGELRIHKAPGRIAEVEKLVRADEAMKFGTIGIAHTRWATHGEPTVVNAHPHTDASGRIAIVHNGIIENYAALREFLAGKGHTFCGQTDTEVLVHLIGEFYHQGATPLEQAVQAALREATGTYGLAVMCRDEPDKIVAARRGLCPRPSAQSHPAHGPVRHAAVDAHVQSDLLVPSNAPGSRRPEEGPADAAGASGRPGFPLGSRSRLRQRSAGRHLLSTDKNGVELGTYAAPIACLLIALWTGGKPTLSTYRMLGWYFQRLGRRGRIAAPVQFPASPSRCSRAA